MRRVPSRVGRAVRATLDICLHRFSEQGRARLRDERGQTTAESALVLLSAAGVALLMLGWATQSGAIGDLFDAVMDGIVGKVR